MTTAMILLLFVIGWLLIAIFGGWLVAQCISEMNSDPLEQFEAETQALLKRINKEMK